MAFNSSTAYGSDSMSDDEDLSGISYWYNHYLLIFQGNVSPELQLSDSPPTEFINTGVVLANAENAQQHLPSAALTTGADAIPASPSLTKLQRPQPYGESQTSTQDDRNKPKRPRLTPDQVKVLSIYLDQCQQNPARTKTNYHELCELTSLEIPQISKWLTSERKKRYNRLPAGERDYILGGADRHHKLCVDDRIDRPEENGTRQSVPSQSYSSQPASSAERLPTPSGSAIGRVLKRQSRDDGSGDINFSNADLLSQSMDESEDPSLALRPEHLPEEDSTFNFDQTVYAGIFDHTSPGSLSGPLQQSVVTGLKRQQQTWQPWTHLGVDPPDPPIKFPETNPPPVDVSCIGGLFNQSRQAIPAANPHPYEPRQGRRIPLPTIPSKDQLGRSSQPNVQIESDPSRPYKCTFTPCCQSFKTKSRWIKHEEFCHAPQIVYICCQFSEAWSYSDPFFDHDKCWTKSASKRRFNSKDALIQHFKGPHKLGNHVKDMNLEDFQVKIPTRPQDLVCGFCGDVSNTWKTRCDHVAEHFKKDLSMSTGIPPSAPSPFVAVTPFHQPGSESTGPAGAVSSSGNEFDFVRLDDCPSDVCSHYGQEGY